MEKKNQLIWFLYACALLFGFSRTTAALTQMMGLSVQVYLLLTAALIFAVLILVYLPVKLLAGTGRWQTWGWEYERKMTQTEWVFLVLLLEVLLCVRLYGTPAGINVEGQYCYREALAFAQRTERGLGSGGLYIRLLYLGMRVFGENYAAFWGNMILQAAGVMFLFLAVHGLTGTVSACSAALGVACIPALHYTTYMAEPQSMLFCIYTLLLFLASLCLNRIRIRKKRERAWGPACFLALLCGFAAAVNVQLAGVLLMAGAELAFILKNTKRTVRALLVCTFCAAAGFCLFFLLESVLAPGSGTLMQSLELFWNRWYRPGNDRVYDAVLHSPTLGDYWAVVPLYLLSFLTLFGTGRTTRKSGVIWVLPLLGALGLNAFGEAPYQEQGIFFALLGIFTGTGLTQMFSAQVIRRRAGLEETADEELDSGNESDDEDESKRACFGAGEDEQEMIQEEGFNVVFEDDQNQNGMRKPKPGEYLDNPLPVPKRHVKKEMDYGFDPEPDQMFFEIPVSDEDDFDL